MLLQKRNTMLLRCSWTSCLSSQVLLCNEEAGREQHARCTACLCLGSTYAGGSGCWKLFGRILREFHGLSQSRQVKKDLGFGFDLVEADISVPMLSSCILFYSECVRIGMLVRGKWVISETF